MSTGIPYANEVLELSGGCTKCSPGCQNCWAIKEVWRMAHNPNMSDKWQGLVEKTPSGLNWTGRIKLFEDVLSRRLPGAGKTYFVDSKTDLFHPSVPFEYIRRVLDTATANKQHTFLFFTKRVNQILEFFQGRQQQRINWRYYKNLRFFLSISTQKELDEKLPTFLQIPVAVRGLSLEPMLEAIRFPLPCKKSVFWSGIHQIIIGAESINGKAGRPCSLDDVRFSVFQCKAAKVPCYLKQVHLVVGGGSMASTDAETHRKGRAWTNYKLSRDPAEWPVDMRVQEWLK